MKTILVFILLLSDRQGQTIGRFESLAECETTRMQIEKVTSEKRAMNTVKGVCVSARVLP